MTNAQHTYCFADRSGEEYRITYQRDRWGRHTWAVRVKSGGGMTATDEQQDENDRDLTPEEIFATARAWAGTMADRRDPQLWEPTGATNEDGSPALAIYLARVTA